MSSDNDNSPPLAADPGLLLLVIASFMAVTSSSFTAIRLIIRRPWKVLLWYDDAFNILAMIFAILHMALCVVTVHAGLGRHDESPPHEHVNRMRSAYYAANVMFVLALASTQLSVGLLLCKVLAACNQQQYQRLLLGIRSIFVAIGIWAIIGIGVFSSPAGRVARAQVDVQYKSFLGMEIPSLILELTLSTASYLLFTSLQLSRWKKLGLVAGISTRVLLHGPAVPHYLSLRNASVHNNSAGDLAWSLIWASLQLHLLVMGAALPCFSPFFKSMNGGHVAATVLPDEAQSGYRSGSHSRARKLADRSGEITLLTQKSNGSSYTVHSNWETGMPNLHMSGQSSRRMQ